MDEPFVDIHCHLLPGMDDGSRDSATSLAMARMALDDGIGTIVATPHQLGNYPANRGDAIRRRTDALSALLAEHQMDLTVLPGGDVRIEEGLVPRILSGEVLTLGDMGRHLLLELPHELYLPLDPLLDRLKAAGLVGILSHPERNAAILRQPSIIGPLVDRGCLMQVTAGSLMGAFGVASRHCAEWMLGEGLIHFLATDAHSARVRRPRLRPAFDRVVELADMATAMALCCRNPASVVRGQSVPPGRRATTKGSRLVRKWQGADRRDSKRFQPAAGWNRWLPWRKAS